TTRLDYRTFRNCSIRNCSMRCDPELARYRTPIVAGQAAGWTNPPFDACRRERRPDHFRRWSCRPGTRDACSQPPAALKTVPMLVTLGSRHDQGGMTVPSQCRSFALLWLLGSASSALAQGPDEFLRTVCRQSISDSWLGNLRECLAHLV